MSLFQLNPRAAETLRTTAAAKIATAVAQKLSPLSIKRIQQLLQFKDFASGLLGLDDITGIPQPLLGGVTLAEARDIYDQLRDAQFARKNLFFVRIVDYNPPAIDYLTGVAATSVFNLFATDVSYPSATLQGEKVQIGSAAMDRVTGREAMDLTVTTMDDSRGTLKRWFDAKVEQTAHDDGTFGLPSDYWLDIEIYHATPTANEGAYKTHARMRAVSIQHDLSRRDQALAEMPLAFTQCDTFIRP